MKCQEQIPLPLNPAARELGWGQIPPAPRLRSV